MPYLDTYVLRIWPDQTAVVNALLNGEIDAAELEPADIAAVEGTPGIVVAHYPDAVASRYYEFNLDPEVTTKWQDQRVRQALLYALDRESIVNDILLGYAEVAQGTQPVISYAYAPDRITTKYTYDPEKAQALLTEAGWTDTDGDGIVDKDGQASPSNCSMPSGSPTRRPARRLHAGCLGGNRRRGDTARAGVPGTDRGDNDQSHTSRSRSTVSIGTPRSSRTPMFGCDQYQVGFNDMKYCNPELDAINDEAKRTFDEDARRELLIQASNIVNDEQPVGVLYFSQDHIALQRPPAELHAQHVGHRPQLRLDPTVAEGDGVHRVIRVLGSARSAKRTPYHPSPRTPSRHLCILR